MDKKELFNHLLEVFNLSREEINEHREYYNNHFEEYGNEIYADIKTRLVHLLNFWEENLWFNERFNLLFENYNSYEEIVDFGYGLPYLTLLLAEEEKLKELPKQVFIDKYQSAEQVSRAILDYLGIEATFITEDIQSKEIFDNLPLNSKRLFVALETVEHLDSQDVFWNNLKKFRGEDLIVSLAVGPKIPSHTLEIESIDKAREYFSKYIDVKKEHTAEPKDLEGRDLDKYKVFSALGTIK